MNLVNALILGRAKLFMCPMNNVNIFVLVGGLLKKKMQIKINRLLRESLLLTKIKAQ